MLHEKYETLFPDMPMEMPADASLIKIYDQPLPTDNIISSAPIQSDPVLYLDESLFKKFHLFITT